jgi:hypothetical protein
VRSAGFAVADRHIGEDALRREGMTLAVRGVTPRHGPDRGVRPVWITRIDRDLVPHRDRLVKDHGVDRTVAQRLGKAGVAPRRPS